MLLSTCTAAARRRSDTGRKRSLTVFSRLLQADLAFHSSKPFAKLDGVLQCPGAQQGRTGATRIATAPHAAFPGLRVGASYSRSIDRAAALEVALGAGTTAHA
jgi:hypothetical protein